MNNTHTETAIARQSSEVAPILAGIEDTMAVINVMGSVGVGLNALSRLTLNRSMNLGPVFNTVAETLDNPLVPGYFLTAVAYSSIASANARRAKSRHQT